MSFLAERKNEIIKGAYKSACCRRALLNGVLFSKGSSDNANIRVHLETDECAEFFSSLVGEFFGKVPEISSLEGGGRARAVSFKSPAADKYIASLNQENPLLFQEKCAFCRSAFVRGIFLSCGRITNPKKQYRLELAPASRHELHREFLLDCGVSLALTDRRCERILYTGNSGVVEDFFALAAMNSTAFLFMNSKIESEFKNNANRIRNCETNNILKNVSAAHKWIEAIEALDEANLLSTLPEELEKTARLRMEYKDYSLARLAAEFTPPISKPGLSHRLNKILEISEKMLGKTND